MLNKRRLFLVCMMTAAGISAVEFPPRAAAQDRFTLSSVIPNDVFLFETCRDNPERKFLDDYWTEVMGALQESGIDEDLAELFGTSLGLSEVQADEIARIRERFMELVGEVKWSEMEGTENAFAERFAPFNEIAEGKPMVVTASMVWLGRGSREATKHNFEALAAILDAIVEEANNAMGREALKVIKSEAMGAQLASVNLLGALPGAPLLPLSVAIRDDLLLIALREDLRDDVLLTMDGKGPKKTLADDARFQAAFSQLPPAEDSLVFFDAQALLNPMRESFTAIFDVVANPHDVYRNTGINAEASEINRKALDAYRVGDHKKALKLVKQAHEIEPRDAIILYNLACFSALVGNQNEALDWLEKAVDGGFYAPHKISVDSDLTKLRNKPRFKKAMAKAADLARDSSAQDMAVNYTDQGDVRRLRMQMQQAYEKKDYDQALTFIKQAHKMAENDSKVLYAMGALHTLKGYKDKGLDYLEQAVESGFYCPKQIAKDPDWKSVRGDKRFEQVLIKAEKMAGKAAAGSRQAKSMFIKHLVDRQMDAAGVLDYSATVESTDGHSVRSETITMLVPDAEDRDIYQVLSQRQPVDSFARYLPKETSAFSISGGVDMRELYKFAEETLREGGPLGEQMLAKWETVQKKLGLNIEQDVFGLIEGDSLMVTLADGGGSVCMIKVSDEKKAHQKIDEAMTELPKMLAKAIAQQPALGGLANMALRSTPLEHETLKQFQSVHVGLAQKPVGVWGTADGYLIFGSSADAVALCLATSRNDHPNVTQNKTTIGEAIVPDGPFISVSLADHRSSSKDIATAMSVASMMGGMVAASIPKPEMRPVVNKMTSMIGKLAPVVRKADFYKSVASATTFDGRMWHSRCVTHYQSPAERTEKEEVHQEVVAE